MPELLLELFSEEIPARFQRRAADDLKKAVTDAIVEAGLLYESARAFVTPRRLALSVTGIPARSPDTREEKKGPRVGAPQQAVDGFLKAAGLSSIDQAKIESDPKKGEFYVAHIEKKGAEAPQSSRPRAQDHRRLPSGRSRCNAMAGSPGCACPRHHGDLRHRQR